MRLHEYVITHTNQDTAATWVGGGGGPRGCVGRAQLVFYPCYMCQIEYVCVCVCHEAHLCQFLSFLSLHHPVMCGVNLEHIGHTILN